MNNEVVLGVQQSLSINYSKIFYNFVKRIVDIIAGIWLYLLDVDKRMACVY